MHNISCHTLLEAFLTSLFVHSILWGFHRKRKKEEATPLFEWVPILSWWLFAFLSDVLVPFWSLPYWSSSADCQLYTTVCLISKVEIIVECYRVVMLEVEESLLQPCHTYTHTYSPLLSPPRTQPPLPLSFSWSPSHNLLVFLETLAVFLKCLSVTWFAATTENSDWRRQEGITTKLFFSCNMDVAVIEIDQVKYKDNPVCPVPSYR